jgi:hypothetical protein
VGEGNEAIINLKKIIDGGKWGMDATCTKENFWNILFKNLKFNEIWERMEVLKCYKRKRGEEERGIEC